MNISNQRIFRVHESIFLIFTGRCNIRSFSQCWVPYHTRKSNRMDIIICGNHCNCCSGESFIHNWMRMYNSHKNHRVLPSYQLIHQRYLISIVVRPLYVKFRNHCRILVRGLSGRLYLLYVPVCLLLFPLHAAVDTFVLGLSLICWKLQVEFRWRRRNGSSSLATYHLSANDLVLLSTLRNAYSLLVDWGQT